MSDIMGKIGELLSDEESVRQLSELAQMMMNDTGEDKSPTDTDSGGSGEESSEKTDPEGTDDGLFPKGFDLSSLMKLQGIMGAMNQKDKNSELLLALKPHLREDKQEKVDKAIKILKLLAIWNVIKDSGLLKDFL
ncbi:MAG: hypothetical protein LUG91_02670 [Ruminococcus sp.]|nr:hypothetical protein [Ruminococcus sp.]